jgi:LysM repeat protein
MAAQQDPGMQQDAEAAREKLLKAADQIDMIQGNSEANKVALDGMKADIARLQAANTDLQQRLAAMQASLDKADADRAKERQALLDEVASLVAAKSGEGSHSAAKHHESALEPPEESSPSSEVHLAKNETPPDSTAADGNDPASASAPPAPKPQKGYYHVVESGETLSMICAAYRDQGVKVTTSELRKANGLTAKSVLKVGQKLFIPKPGD